MSQYKYVLSDFYFRLVIFWVNRLLNCKVLRLSVNGPGVESFDGLHNVIPLQKKIALFIASKMLMFEFL